MMLTWRKLCALLVATTVLAATVGALVGSGGVANATGWITGSDVADETLRARHIADNSISHHEIRDGTIDTDDIARFGITREDLDSYLVPPRNSYVVQMKKCKRKLGGVGWGPVAVTFPATADTEERTRRVWFCPFIA